MLSFRVLATYRPSIFRIIRSCDGLCAFASLTHKRSHATIIDGVGIAQDIKDEVRKEISEWVAVGKRRPKLTAIIVGDDPASRTYIKNKIKAAQYTGIESQTIPLPSTISEAELLAEVELLNNDHSVDGILVQLPVPPHISERKVCNAVHPSKDVDGFHVVNIGRFCSDLTSLVPATPAGVIEMIRRTGIETFGKHAVVCGRSKNVGMPISMLLHADGRGETNACDATVTICHRFTPLEDMAKMTRVADIVVTATGIPNLITADIIKPGACIIDVGITRIKDESTGKFRLVGDVDFEGVRQKAGHITPVPGGVGPMTVAMLMKNTLIATKKHISYDF